MSCSTSARTRDSSRCTCAGPGGRVGSSRTNRSRPRSERSRGTRRRIRNGRSSTWRSGRPRGRAPIHIAANSQSSSLLPMLEAHRSAAPESAYVGEETVDVMPLDDALAGVVTESDRLCIKLDCQGYEGQVLDGASKSARADGHGDHGALAGRPLRGRDAVRRGGAAHARRRIRAREHRPGVLRSRRPSSCCRSTAASSPFPETATEPRPRLRPRWRTKQRNGAGASRRRHSTRCRCTTTCSSPASSSRGPMCSSTRSPSHPARSCSTSRVVRAPSQDVQRPNE